MKVIFHYVVAAIICFSLMGMCSGDEDFFHTPYNDAKMGSAHPMAGAFSVPMSFHLHHIHDSRGKDLPDQCSGTSSKDTPVCAGTFILANTSKSHRSSLISAISAQIPIGCFQLSERTFISEISNPTNPTLSSLRTVILLA